MIPERHRKQIYMLLFLLKKLKLRHFDAGNLLNNQTIPDIKKPQPVIRALW